MADLPRDLNQVHPVAVGFSWSRLAHRPRMRPSKVHDLALRNLRRLANWGIAVPADSRLRRVEQQLRRWIDADVAPVEPRARKLIAEAIRNVAEFYIATHGLDGRPDNITLEKYKRALGGADLPEDEEQHQARDTQLELNVYGVLSAGGLKPWFDEHPDIRFPYGETAVGVAVKRLWSLERAHNQLSLAAAQIEASGLRGIIAVNAQEYLELLPEDERVDIRGEAFNRQVARLHGHFPYLFGKPHVIGLLVCGTVAEWSDADQDRPPQLRIATYNQLFTIATDDEEQARLEAFFASMEPALRNWMDMNL